MLSPTGPLAVLPWGLLPSLRGCPVVVGYSGTAWLRASAGPSRPGGRVVAIAGPGLAHAEAEAKTVAQYWPAGDQLSGPAADQAAVKAALAEASVLHLAAHGTHQPENPLFSSIRLADGPLFAYELDDTSRPAEHVVLAACELGQATIRPGDEALGLTSVLLHLGTRSVISGVAKVHDEVAAEVMVGYHRALSRGRRLGPGAGRRLRRQRRRCRRRSSASARPGAASRLTGDRSARRFGPPRGPDLVWPDGPYSHSRSTRRPLVVACAHATERLRERRSGPRRMAGQRCCCHAPCALRRGVSAFLGLVSRRARRRAATET